MASDPGRYDGSMLDTVLRWRIDADSAFLDYGPVNVANVQRWRGELTLVIRWQGKTVGGPVGSIAQGMRWADRWIGARPGWPGKRQRRWYDEVEEKRMAAVDLRTAHPRRRSSPLRNRE